MEFDLEPVLKPLSPDAQGVSPQGLDLYDKVQEQIDQLDGIEKTPVDWSFVEKSTLKIITELSKDLRSASYLSIAMLETKGLDGLNIGLQILTGLITSEYASELFPYRRKKPEKARSAAFVWLASMLTKYFDKEEINVEKFFAEYKVFLTEFKSMNNSLVDYLGDATPVFSELNAHVNRIKATVDDIEVRLEEEKAKAEAAEKESSSSNDVDPSADSSGNEPEKLASNNSQPSKAATPIASPTSANSPADVDKALMSISNSLKSVAKALTSEPPYNANSFYYSRTAKWLMVQQLPPDGIMPKQPSDETLARIAALEKAKKYSEVITLCENEINNGAMYYMALSRHVYNALKNLEEDNCASVVLSTTLNFYQRFPELSQLSFNNGEPFIDVVTQKWLEKNSKGTSSSGGGQASQQGEADAEMTKAIDKASELVEAGKIDEAFTVFQKGIQSSNNPKEKLIWQYELAVLVSSLGNHEMAVLQLDHIFKQLNDLSAAQWQPSLTAKVVKLLLENHNKRQLKIKYDPVMLEKIENLKQTLIILSPADAIAFTTPTA